MSLSYRTCVIEKYRGTSFPSSRGRSCEASRVESAGSDSTLFGASRHEPLPVLWKCPFLNLGVDRIDLHCQVIEHGFDNSQALFDAEFPMTAKGVIVTLVLNRLHGSVRSAARSTEHPNEHIFGNAGSMIYLGTDSGLYRWTHHASWPTFHSLQGARIRTVLAGGEGRLTVADDAGRLFESTTNGESWRAVDLPVGVSACSAYALGGTPLTMILATKPLGLYARAHGTSWWAKLAVPEAAKDAEVTAMAVTKGAQPALLAAFAGAGLYRSADGAKTWTKIEGVPATIRTIRSVGETVAIGTDQGVWTSVDNGIAFAAASSGPADAPAVYALDIAPNDAKWMLAGAAAGSPAMSAGGVRPQGFKFGLYETKDGGKTWAKVVKRGLPELVAFDTISDIRFDPADPDNILMAQGSGECWLTKNGGDYWTVLSRAIESARALAASA